MDYSFWKKMSVITAFTLGTIVGTYTGAQLNDEPREVYVVRSSKEEHPYVVVKSKLGSTHPFAYSQDGVYKTLSNASKTLQDSIEAELKRLEKKGEEGF